MLVISGTGPLRYLIEIGSESILPKLYGTATLLTTPDVIRELRLPHFPEMVRQWATSPPDWLEIEAPLAVEFLDRLDAGEASAISLAKERSADLVLIDERDGTAVARGIGLQAYGTLGVLALAGARGQLDFDRAIDELVSKTLFRITRAGIEQARLRYRELCGENPATDK